VILNLHYLLLIHKVFYVFIRTSHTDIDSCVYLTEHKAIKIIQSFILFFFSFQKKIGLMFSLFSINMQLMNAADSEESSLFFLEVNGLNL
jgi:hypothetical protein